jgi:hypothetical protein
MLVRLPRQIPVRKRKHDVQTLPHKTSDHHGDSAARPWAEKVLPSMYATSAQLTQKTDRVNRSRALLHLLQQLQPFDFEGITTGEES